MRRPGRPCRARSSSGCRVRGARGRHAVRRCRCAASASGWWRRSCADRRRMPTDGQPRTPGDWSTLSTARDRPDNDVVRPQRPCRRGATSNWYPAPPGLDESLRLHRPRGEGHPPYPCCRQSAHPVVLTARTDRDRVDSVPGQMPGLKLWVWPDPGPCAFLKVDDQRAMVTHVDRGDRLPVER